MVVFPKSGGDKSDRMIDSRKTSKHSASYYFFNTDSKCTTAYWCFKCVFDVCRWTNRGSLQNTESTESWIVPLDSSYISWNQSENGTMSSAAPIDPKQQQKHCTVTHTVPNTQQCRCARCRLHDSVGLVISYIVGRTDVYVVR